MDTMIKMRPIRIRKHSRKSWTQNGDSDRPLKRLFTPEIKKMLKDWLIRRRQNPYPSRDEKKALAVETGLTYTQICNWFANWRRKLKNTSAQKKSWGNLIKNYNFNAKGNVEQFSICSSDSIWGDAHRNDDIDSLDSESYQNSDSEAQDLSSKTNHDMHFDDQQFKAALSSMAAVLPTGSFFNSQNSAQLAMNFFAQAQQCFQISSTSDLQQNESQKNQYFANSNKFKNHIMEKYLRGLDDETNNNNNIDENLLANNMNTQASDNSKKPELSKWLESTANFQPSKNNYNIDFVKNEKSKKKTSKSSSSTSLCEKELIAAETLVLLKNNFRTKFYNS